MRSSNLSHFNPLNLLAGIILKHIYQVTIKKICSEIGEQQTANKELIRNCKPSTLIIEDKNGNKVWRTRRYPGDQTSAAFIPIYKTGSTKNFPDLPYDYLEFIYESSFLKADRSNTKKLEPKILPEQAGCDKGRGTRRHANLRHLSFYVFRL